MSTNGAVLDDCRCHRLVASNETVLLDELFVVSSNAQLERSVRSCVWLESAFSQCQSIRTLARSATAASRGAWVCVARERVRNCVDACVLFVGCCCLLL